MVVKNDKDVMKMFDHWDEDHPIESYIHHLEPGSQAEELVLDYCQEWFHQPLSCDDLIEGGSVGCSSGVNVDAPKEAATIEKRPEETIDAHVSGDGVGAEQCVVDVNAPCASGVDMNTPSGSGVDESVHENVLGVGGGIDVNVGGVEAGSGVDEAVHDSVLSDGCGGVDVNVGGVEARVGVAEIFENEEGLDEFLANAMEEWENETISDEEYFHGYKVVKNKGAKSKASLFGFEIEESAEEQGV